MNTVCELNRCSGCMACVDVCPKGAVKILDDLTAYNAVISEEKCVDCGVCHKVCQENHMPQAIPPFKWYQGWAESDEIRKNSSSGGFATAIARAFVNKGGVVCSCIFNEGKFTFQFAENEEDVKNFVGSKYVKSNPSGIYKQIRAYLQEKKKVLFIGLPCQVAAVRNVIGNNLQEELYTADLICHGTPSPRLLDLFLKQYGKSLDQLKDIQFRVKAKMQVHGDHQGLVRKGVSDKYTIAFLNSLSYTDNCYECNYAQKSRVSDITLGDSWGSELSLEEQKKGVSLVLCQTQKGTELLKQAELHLEAVDLDKAIASNHQLAQPSELPESRKEFFDGIEKKKSFNSMVFKAFPKQCLRQDIKETLIKMKIIQGGVGKINYGILVLERDITGKSEVER